MRAIAGWPAAVGRQLADSIRWASGRRIVPPGTTPIAYGRSAATFLWAITAMTVVETAIVELAVPWAWLRITLAVVCIGSLPLMAGMVAAYRIHPHLLGERTLLVRHARDWEVEIPLSLIASIGTTLGTPPRRPGIVGSALELGVGTNDVVISLRSPQQMADHATGTTATIDRIRCSADDPGTFVRLVNQARQARESPAALPARTTPVAADDPGATEDAAGAGSRGQSLRR